LCSTLANANLCAVPIRILLLKGHLIRFLFHVSSGSLKRKRGGKRRKERKREKKGKRGK
jgi:hypothetical protein